MAKDFRIVALLASLLILTACPQSNNTGVGDGGSGDLSLKAEQVACQVPTDCKIVSLSCCDFCNGGQVASVNKNHAENVLAEHKQTGCEKYPCTLTACLFSLPFAYCDRGTCAYMADLAVLTTCVTAEDCTSINTGCAMTCTEGDVAAVNKTSADFYTQQVVPSLICGPGESPPVACGTPELICQLEQCMVIYPALSQ